MTATAPANRNWEDAFASWGQPPSQSERDKCDNAERAIRRAIDAADDLHYTHSIEVFAQGSYRNRTNVRFDSDVDICVRCTDTFFYDVANGISLQEAGILPASYPFADFKNDVGRALINHFGIESILRGDKAFDVHANTYRVDADVVPTFEYRWFYRGRDGRVAYHSGTKFFCDSGPGIINWPQQNYDNGVAKNAATDRRFKATVRILKRLRNEMDDSGIAAAAPIPSYLSECLVWNVPNEGFGHSTYTADVRSVLAHLWNNTRADDACGEWVETNELKYLFRSGQPWTREQVNTFLQAAWNYINFE